jgi:radical SAM superfamily enzyme YgiQ (UPF0313 family)
MWTIHMRALLISTYELGHQPFGLASPAAWLRAAGCEVDCADVAKERLADQLITGADLIGFHLPMHTATRLAVPLIRRARRLNPTARICAYGLYAPLNAAWLRTLGIDEVFGGEFEEALTRYATRAAGQEAPAAVPPSLPRLKFLVPDRSGLPPLERYATLRFDDGREKRVGQTEASRGCRHLCRHCPVVPVYNGQFRVVQPDIVLADIDAQVRAGAEHITFGDPDFFNGPTHALRIVEALSQTHPGVTYDVTIKIEHLLRHRDVLPRLVETGCAFVTSAVESIDDHVLARLDKGHTAQDFKDAVDLCRSAGLVLTPTFVAFHPWLTLDGYCDLLDTIEALDLVDHVAPIQLAIRLLLPEGSRLLELDEVRALVTGFDPGTLTYQWSNADSRLAELHRDVMRIVGVKLVSDRRMVFDQISDLVHERTARSRPSPASRPASRRLAVPHLSEPWYCCAEPSAEHMNLV